MNDKIDNIGKTFFHHGKNSNRLYIMSTEKSQLQEVMPQLEQLAQNEGYTKIIAKIPEDCKNYFIEHGYQQEAVIPNLFLGKTDGYFFCKYSDEKRKNDYNKVQLDSVLDMIKNMKDTKGKKSVAGSFIYNELTNKDTSDICQTYKKIFKSYPFPIFDMDYIKSTMLNNVYYFGVWDGENLIALSSAEVDPKKLYAEMTDFAVLEEYRGFGLAQNLLKKMEEKLINEGIKTFYSIARACSIGMNRTFMKNGYRYSGRLINNTDIGGQIESMNIWYKNI